MAAVKTGKSGIQPGFVTPPKAPRQPNGQPIPAAPKVVRLALPRNYSAIPGGYLIRERA